ncbi:hypothetical protein NZ698_13565 [Chryseobacterium sp. PBS4-4]|uniref:DUF541 domain-containing protein n=1 Tax=Chryseobacterium edaphi TaxID=2976532 RepID=A0ABT2W7N9_9FLAO|nr:hypothetical protein [Chryseobacterium edaphi]MCU7618232.1 hypothetical protein [Chryseobacterium edaphi]
MKNLNQKTDLRFFITLLSFTFFCFSNAYAQRSENPTQVEQAIVVLKNGAKIYSTDEAFNKQISNHVIILKNVDPDKGNNTNDKILTESSIKPEEFKKDFKENLQASIQKKQKEELKKIKKEIDKHEVRKKTFVINDLKKNSSSDEFLASTRISKNSVVLEYNNFNFSKTFLAAHINIVKLALDFLHSQKYVYYNNTSLDFCFSTVFSVRPPPVLI